MSHHITPHPIPTHQDCSLTSHPIPSHHPYPIPSPPLPSPPLNRAAVLLRGGVPALSHTPSPTHPPTHAPTRTALSPPITHLPHPSSLFLPSLHLPSSPPKLPCSLRPHPISSPPPQQHQGCCATTRRSPCRRWRTGASRGAACAWTTRHAYMYIYIRLCRCQGVYVYLRNCAWMTRHAAALHTHAHTHTRNTGGAHRPARGGAPLARPPAHRVHLPAGACVCPLSVSSR